MNIGEMPKEPGATATPSELSLEHGSNSRSRFSMRLVSPLVELLYKCGLLDNEVVKTA